MKCPVCADATLLMSERQGVEIDYCPTCRGVWLDRGELDKLIQLSSTQQPQAVQHEPVMRQPNYSQPYEKKYSDHDKYHYGYHRRKSWLSEIFD